MVRDVVRQAPIIDDRTAVVTDTGIVYEAREKPRENRTVHREQSAKEEQHVPRERCVSSLRGGPDSRSLDETDGTIIESHSGRELRASKLGNSGVHFRLGARRATEWKHRN